MMYNNTAFQPRRRRRFPLVSILILLIVFGGIGFLVNRVQAGNVVTVDCRHHAVRRYVAAGLCIFMPILPATRWSSRA